MAFSIMLCTRKISFSFYLSFHSFKFFYCTLLLISKTCSSQHRQRDNFNKMDKMTTFWLCDIVAKVEECAYSSALFTVHSLGNANAVVWCNNPISLIGFVCMVCAFERFFKRSVCPILLLIRRNCVDRFIDTNILVTQVRVQSSIFV